MYVYIYIDGEIHIHTYIYKYIYIYIYIYQPSLSYDDACVCSPESTRTMGSAGAISILRNTIITEIDTQHNATILCPTTTFFSNPSLHLFFFGRTKNTGHSLGQVRINSYSRSREYNVVAGRRHKSQLTWDRVDGLPVDGPALLVDLASPLVSLQLSAIGLHVPNLLAVEALAVVAGIRLADALVLRLAFVLALAFALLAFQGLRSASGRRSTRAPSGVARSQSSALRRATFRRCPASWR